jgi:hypothetical protein
MLVVSLLLKERIAETVGAGAAGGGAFSSPI